MIRKHAPHAKRLVFETRPLSTWFYHALTAEGIPAICIEARHAQKVLDETLIKTGANDADGLAQLGEAGFYKAVRVKAFDTEKGGLRAPSFCLLLHRVLNRSIKE